jgi:hypothetical protein
MTNFEQISYLLRNLVEIGHVNSEYRQLFYEIEINLTNIDQIWQLFCEIWSKSVMLNLTNIGNFLRNRNKSDQYRPNLATIFCEIWSKSVMLI